jgi:hypothetical protein
MAMNLHIRLAGGLKPMWDRPHSIDPDGGHLCNTTYLLSRDTYGKSKPIFFDFLWLAWPGLAGFG